jgi:hypothetical protein
MSRGSIVDVGGTAVPASPIRMITTDGRATQTATSVPPQVGTDTTDILTAAGFSSPELESLAAKQWRGAGGTHGTFPTTDKGLGGDIDAHIAYAAKVKRLLD